MCSPLLWFLYRVQDHAASAGASTPGHRPERLARRPTIYRPERTATRMRDFNIGGVLFTILVILAILFLLGVRVHVG